VNQYALGFCHYLCKGIKQAVKNSVRKTAVVFEKVLFRHEGAWRAVRQNAKTEAVKSDKARGAGSVTYI